MDLKKTARAIFVFSIAFLVLTLTSFSMLYKANISEPNELICTPLPIQPFCGTNTFPKSPEGRKAFNTKCAACHKLSARSTGPALRNVDSLVYQKWLQKKNTKFDTLKFEKMDLYYHNYLASEKLDSVEVAAIFEYTR